MSFYLFTLLCAGTIQKPREATEELLSSISILGTPVSFQTQYPIVRSETRSGSRQIFIWIKVKLFFLDNCQLMQRCQQVLLMKVL